VYNQLNNKELSMTEGSPLSDEFITHIKDIYLKDQVGKIEQARQVGKEVWARMIGQVIITSLTNMRFLDSPKDRHLGEAAQETIKLLTPHLVELHNDPEYGQGMTEGLILELANRRYLDLTDTQIGEMYTISNNRKRE
jgi:hypothetical protein